MKVINSNLKLHFFDSVTSSCDLAAQMLSEGCAPPFAICVKEQSKGRGRRGRTWNSPQGGLYITIVTQTPDSDPLTILPIKAAILFAQYLEAKTGLFLSIKWPNDILCGKSKLAGILCESSQQGSSLGPFMVSIGLNVNTKPGDQAYATTSLSQLTNQDYDINSMAQGICSYWDCYWAKAMPEFKELFEKHQSLVTRYWINSNDASEKIFLHESSLASDASLNVKALNSGLNHKLISVSHSFSSALLVNYIPRLVPFVFVFMNDKSAEVFIYKKGKAHIYKREKREELDTFLLSVLSASFLENSWPVFYRNNDTAAVVLGSKFLYVPADLDFFTNKRQATKACESVSAEACFRILEEWLMFS